MNNKFDDDFMDDMAIMAGNLVTCKHFGCIDRRL